MVSAKHRATYEQLLALPAGVVGELVDGELYASPRPATRHALATSGLGGELHGPFRLGRGGPGGWIFLDEPELHLGEDVVVPDLAGWRRERLPDLVDAPFLTLAPDWVAETLSPSTQRLDRAKKLPLYGRAGVEWVWLVDPLAQTLEVLHRQGGAFSLLLVAAAEDRVRAAPFEALELDLAVLWTP